MELIKAYRGMGNNQVFPVYLSIESIEYVIIGSSEYSIVTQSGNRFSVDSDTMNGFFGSRNKIYQ